MLSPSVWDDADVTDTRLPDRWLVSRRFVTLPEPAFKLYVLSMMWSVSNRTDGLLYPDDLDYVPCPSGEEIRKVLLDSEHWVIQGDAYLIQDFLPTQTSAAQLAANEAYAARERERKAIDRASKRKATPDRPADRRTDIRKTGQERTETGEATRGEAVTEGPPTVPSPRARDRTERGWDE